MGDRLNLNEPRWDQSTYSGRVKHFMNVTNPANVLCTDQQLDQAKDIVTRYNNGESVDLPSDAIWRAKTLVDSAFHPDTGEKMNIIGRMSAQVPMNMTITGCMMTFYKTTPQVVFWQWANQSFNALVNYTNRSGTAPISQQTLATSYVAATGGALVTALGLNSLVKSAPPVVGRLVPFVAVCAANSINIPMMRKSELINGVPLFTKEGESIGDSKIAAREGISKVVFSRILMAAPGMVLVPFAMNSLDKRGFFKRFPRLNAPLQILMVGFCLTFATPLCCAIFEQKASIHVDKIETHLKEKLQGKDTQYLYYNKGL